MYNFTKITINTQLPDKCQIQKILYSLNVWVFIILSFVAVKNRKIKNGNVCN